ncbi:P-II family nitrogen regulator [Clostridiaceae bacterium 35-E11]
MYVLFIVINDAQHVKKILPRMRELGVKGATVIDTMGAGRYEESALEGMPIIGGLMSSLNLGIVHNKTIFSVMESEKQVAQVADAVEEILGGNMGRPGTGIMFSFPVNMVRGGMFPTNIINKEKPDSE